MDLPYYFTFVNSPYAIKHTDQLDELVRLLYNDEIQFLTEHQVITEGLPENYLDQLKKEISSYSDQIPMYDIMSNRIFLIARENLYVRVFQDSYRFVTQQFYDSLVNMKMPDTNNLENIRILSFYDLPALQNTFYKVFYQSFALYSYVTHCERPSFASRMEHIKPYYTLDELYFLAYDWGLTKSDQLSEDQIQQYCADISQYDIPATTLIDHQIYIYDYDAIGLVKHYTLFGSSYMNNYLRENKCTMQTAVDYSKFIRNQSLENQIKIMIRLISGAPAFIRPHTVYRFVESDGHLRHLKPGDIYTDCSFTSTTRNPFYYKENNMFGFIMMKIKIPANITGIGISVEAYSNFPIEEEIIMTPTSQYRLISVADATPEDEKFYGTFQISLIRKYEFEWIGNGYRNINPDSQLDAIKLDMPGAKEEELQLVTVNELLDKYAEEQISDRLDKFQYDFINKNNQFIIRLLGNEYVMTVEAYDSSGVYKPYFYYTTSNGIMITTNNPEHGNINLMMEIDTEIHVNYYFLYSVTDPSESVNLDKPEWLEWFSMFTYIIGCRSVVFHSDYTLNRITKGTYYQKQMATRYTYSDDIYQFMKHGKKKFDYTQVTTNFQYHQLTLLFSYPVDQLIKPTDHNELYRIATKNEIANLGDLYLWIVEKEPKHIQTYLDKVADIYSEAENPFTHVTYTLDAWMYLYDKRIITTMPNQKAFKAKKGSFSRLIKKNKYKMFDNRLRRFLQNQRQ